MNRALHLACGIVVCFQLASSCVAYDEEIDRALKALRGISPSGRLTICVVDASNRPIDKAEVTAFFVKNAEREIQKSGFTDKDGLFSATVQTGNEVAFFIKKSGYYDTRFKYVFYEVPNATIKRKRWLPWNPTLTNVLREIRHPIPMYARNCRVVIPVRDVPVGFDLLKCSLVQPYGSGTNADIYFTLSGKIPELSEGSSIFPSNVTLVCSNKWDGFLLATNEGGSVFQTAYEAPTNGYFNRIVWHYDITNEQTRYTPEIGLSTHYLFRVRTVRNEKNDIIGGLYGRMHRPMELGNGSGRNEILFVYYLNPTLNDRNLESDPQQNLFGSAYRLGVP